MTKEKLSWGIISTALIGEAHVIPAMLKSDKLTVDAVASRDGAKGRQFADTFGIPKAYGSYEDMLADPEIDAVYNPLPNHLHVPWTIKAMEAGKHVLCEKPIALDAAEARQLIDARERTGKLVAEAFMVRHHPQWQRVRALVDEGALGKVRVIQTMFSYHLTDPDNVRNMADIGGGALYDIGCYAILTSRYVFNREPVRVVSMIERDPKLQIDRLTSAMVDYGDGDRLLFSCGTQLVPHQTVSVFGTDKSVMVEIPFNQDPTRPARLRIDDGGYITGSAPTWEALPPSNHYTLQAEAFGAAVAAGGPLAYPIEDAVANMAVIDAVFESAKTGAWVSL
ncbi:MAG: Gfo/Idh/MocA family oxidoreductase [Acuticoccus sp.]